MYLSKPALLCGLMFNCVKFQMNYLPPVRSPPTGYAIYRSDETTKWGRPFPRVGTISDGAVIHFDDRGQTEVAPEPPEGLDVRQL